MSQEVSLFAFAAALGLLILAFWQGHREREPGRPALVPWTGVQFVALTACVLLLIHLVGLWTGAELIGGRRR